MRRIRSVLLLLRFPPDFAGGGLQASRLMEQLGRHGVEMQALTARHEAAGGAASERAFGGRVRRFRVYGRLWVRNVLLSLQASLWLLVHPRWDLLHCSGFSWFAVLPIWVARLLGRPVLVKTTVLGPDGAFNPGGGALSKRILSAYKHADVIVALSRALEEDLRAQPGMRARIVQLPNGVDTDRFRPPRGNERREARERFGLPGDALVITSVAMLYPRKNVAALVRAVGRMQHRPVCLAMAGPPGPDPSYLADLEAAIAALPEGTSAVRLGALEPARLADLARASDVFALMSRAEGLPNALLEAMASGLACLASDIPGAADVLADGGGVLVPLDDDAALAAALDRLAADPQERRRLGEEARGIVLERYSFETIASRYRALYDSMLGEGAER